MKPFKPHTIGIIGGTGRMGRWFAARFKKHGYAVLSSGRHTTLTANQLVRRSDVVIFSVPIPAMEETIHRVIKHVRKDQLLMDFCSLKVVPVHAMLKSNAQVIGMHPMFGPFSRNMKGKPVIICPARTSASHLRWLTDFLASEGARVKTIPARDHDKAMAIIQMLTHLRNFVFAETIKKLHMSAKSFLELASPPSRIEFDCMGRILTQNLDTYAAIATHNPHRKKVLQAYQAACKKLSAQIDSGNTLQFERTISDLARHFKNIAPQCQKESDLLIEQLTNHIS